MLFKFVAGNNLKNVLKKSNAMLSKNIIPIINYITEDCKENKETSVFNEYNNLLDKIDNRFMIAIKSSSFNFNKDYANIIAEKCSNKNIKLIIDAENENNIEIYRKHSNELIYTFNKNNLNIIKTHQLYRKDSLNELKDDINFFNSKNIFFSTKLVRGAYWNSEHKLGHLFTNKQDTDNNYNEGVLECFNNINNNFIAATHNKLSIDFILNLNKRKKKIILANLMGMNEEYLKKLDCTKATYIPYGPYKEMIPYLIRRLYENIDQIKYIHL
jgi:proline dehydrogenase